MTTKNKAAQDFPKGRRNGKGKEKNRPEDDETEALEAQRPRKLSRGEKLLVSRSSTPSSLSKPLSPSDIIFGVTAGSGNHCTVPFFITKEGHDNVKIPLHYEIETPKKLSFGVTTFQGKPNSHMAVVPLMKDIPSDAQHLDRYYELQAICRNYLLSEDAADMWQQVGIEQPKSLEELLPHWVSPVHTWIAKRSKEQFTDIRLKFNVNFQKVKEFVAKDLRVADDSKQEADLNDIPEGTLMKGIYGYRELFLRPQKTGKLAPYTCGLSAYAKDVEFHPNPDDSYVLAD